MSSRLRLVAAATLALVVLAACGSPSSTPVPTEQPTSTPDATPGSAKLILRVTTEGGFIAASASLGAVPAVSVYDDGRIFTPAPPPDVSPGPLVPGIRVRDLGGAGAAAIIAAIRTAGLDKEAPPAGIPGDTGVTVFAVSIDAGTVRTRYALGGGPGGPGGPGVPAAGGDPAVAAARDLLAKLVDPAETWGQPAPAETAYVPAGYLIFVAPGAPPTDPAGARSPVPWPLSTTLGEFGSPSAFDRGISGLRQGTALGADAATLGPVFDEATSATAFTSAGQPYTLFVRPLFPDELGAIR